MEYSAHPTGTPPQADLHAHAGSSVDSAILWSIAHKQGIRLPTKDYWEFTRMITMFGRSEPVNGMDELDKMYHMTEMIQSSPESMESLVKNIIGGAYRSNNIVLIEPRFNPMKRNRGGERDLDHLILASIRGMERAVLEYPQVRAGLILMLDRTFTLEQNAILVKKAIRYQGRGVVGIDLAGPQSKDFRMADHKPLFEEAHAAGLGITVHTGEEGNAEEMRYVVEHVRPQRIGHGIMAAQDRSLMEGLIEGNITLELCPTSNLNTGAIRDTGELRQVIRSFVDAGVRITINTDGPEMHATNLAKEFELLQKNGILSEEETAQIRQAAFAASFVGQ